MTKEIKSNRVLNNVDVIRMSLSFDNITKSLKNKPCTFISPYMSESDTFKVEHDGYDDIDPITSVDVHCQLAQS